MNNTVYVQPIEFIAKCSSVRAVVQVGICSSIAVCIDISL